MVISIDKNPFRIPQLAQTRELPSTAVAGGSPRVEFGAVSPLNQTRGVSEPFQTAALQGVNNGNNYNLERPNFNQPNYGELQRTPPAGRSPAVEFGAVSPLNKTGGVSESFQTAALQGVNSLERPNFNQPNYGGTGGFFPIPGGIGFAGSKFDRIG